MNHWKEELQEIDTLTNHKKTLNRVMEAFLFSDYANCPKQRAKTIILFNHFKKAIIP